MPDQAPCFGWRLWRATLRATPVLTVAPRPGFQPFRSDSSGANGLGVAAVCPDPFAPDESDRKGWKPGRGATVKTGVARKVARHKRHPKHGA